jgi:hypothetical protein
MTSRTHRGIGLVFIPLLAIVGLLVLQAAPPSSASITKKKVHNKSAGVSEKSKCTEEHLKNLTDIAKCPFKIQKNYNGFTEVICDLSNCIPGSWCDDCKQAYLYAKDIIPKTGCEKEMRKRAKIPVGCIYAPKDKDKSRQSPGPEKPVV